MFKSISQRAFIKGLSAAQSRFAQLPNSVQRIKNLLYDERGALRTCDGTGYLSKKDGAVQTAEGPWTAIELFQPTGVDPQYVGVLKDINTPLGAPTTLAVSNGGAGGTLAAGTYYYVVTALDGTGGETVKSNEVNITIAINERPSLTWDAKTNANGYNVYRGTAAGVVTFLIKVATNSYLDTGSATPTAQVPPTADTTEQVRLYKIPSLSYATGNTLKLLPADVITPIDDEPGRDDGGGSGGTGGGGDSGGAGGTGGTPATPTGGVAGTISPLPQIVQFTDKMIFCLGNGFKPQVYDGSTVADIANTFASAYPIWEANLSYDKGDIVKPSPANAHIYKCIQAGIAGAAQPTFPTTTDAVVADKSIMWQEAGSDTAGTAPPGAAHGIVHAGAFWVANTSPTNTANGLDGPSALRMSNINNPNSWNPINTAFIGKDDGSQIMGLATFTIAESGVAPAGALVVFKEFATYMVNGVFGSVNFSIQRVQTDMGCVAPRSITFLPGFGIARLTHLGIAIFDGVRDRLISEEIRPYLFGGQDDIRALDWNYAYFSKGAQVADPPMFSLAIPLRQVAMGTIGTFNKTGSGGDSNVRIGYCRFVGLDAEGVEVQVGTLKGPVTKNANERFAYTTPATLPSGVTKFRVYSGPAPSRLYKHTDLDAGEANFSSTLGAGAPLSFGNLSRILTYDMVLKAWSVVDLPFPISVLNQVRSAGLIPVTLMGGYNDGTVRRWQMKDTLFGSDAVKWKVRGIDIFPGAPTERMYLRRLFIRGEVTGTASITATVRLNGSDEQAYVGRTFTLGNGQFEVEVPIHRNALNANVELAGTGRIIIQSIDWNAVPKVAGVPVRAS